MTRPRVASPIWVGKHTDPGTPGGVSAQNVCPGKKDPGGRFEQVGSTTNPCPTASTPVGYDGASTASPLVASRFGCASVSDKVPSEAALSTADASKAASRTGASGEPSSGATFVLPPQADARSRSPPRVPR